MTSKQDTRDFEAWMYEQFQNVEGPGELCTKPSSGQYVILTNSQSKEINCFSHAVYEFTKNLKPQTWTELDRIYSEYGFYPASDDIRQRGDVEVYANPRDKYAPPVHAHRIVCEDTGMCISKIGQDFAITHGTDLLQCRKRASNRYRWGVVKRKYRRYGFSVAKLTDVVTKTRSGRVVKATRKLS